MKTEHELLKEICDKIWYDSNFDYTPVWFNCWLITWYNEIVCPHTRRIINVREIIFTPEFMDRYFKYIFTNTNWDEDTYWKIIIELIDKNLNNPVSYLATLLEIKK